jgi:glucan 1,3-beta-glucosidase
MQQGRSSENPRAGAPLRGVNLGSWLLLEKWMTPGVFRGTDAPDEYTLCRTLGARAAERLDAHRRTFITAEDFRWIKAHGLDAVRLPVGYWALDAPPPFVEARRFVDFAFEQAARNNLKVLLDLHGAPGSQNGMDHSGRSGEMGWHKSPQNIEQTLDALEALAKRYGGHPALWGIELLNEPRWDMPLDVLQAFYQDAYKRLRPRLPARVAIVLHDAFRPFEWKNFLAEPEGRNVLLDTHLYQAYTDTDRKRTAQEHIAFALDRKQHLDAMAKQLPLIVGEWSIATPPEVWRGLSPFAIEAAKRAYGAAELLSYETTRGWFYWSYKLERPSDWSFRHCVERGWLPGSFASS